MTDEKFKHELKTIMLVILSLFMFSNCTNKHKKYNYIHYKNLRRPDKTVQLQSNVFNQYELYWPTGLAVMSDYLLLIDSKADEKIKIHDLESCKLLKSFGRSGEGPSEFIGAWEIIPCPKDKNMFWIFDGSARKVKKYDLNKVLNDHHHPDKIITIKGANGFPNQLIITPDDKILGIGRFVDCRISIYDMNGELTGRMGKIPVVLKKDKFVAGQHSHGFIGRFVLKSLSKEIFIATRYADLVEKYDIEGNLLTTFFGPDSFFPAYEIVPAGNGYSMTYNEKTRLGYLDICYNEKLDRLFLLYSGKYHSNKKNQRANFSNIIYVLDHKGTLIEQIEIDEEIFTMAISDDGSTLYGLTDTEILKFEYEK